MADGHIKISSRIDNSRAKSDFKELEQLIQEYGGKSEEVLGMELEKLASKHEELTSSIGRNIDNIQDLELEIANLQTMIQAHNRGKELLDDETLARANVELSSARKQLEKAQDEAVRLEEAMFNTTLSTERFKVKMGNVVERTERARDATAQVRKESDKLGKSTSLGVGKLGRYALALFSIRSVYGMLSKLSNNWLNSNTEAANQTKAQIEQMTNMLSSALAPVIQWLVNLAATLLGYVSAILKAFFGIDITAKKSAKNTAGMAKGAKETNKELKRMLAGFDEVEKLSSDTADNMGGGGGGGIDEINIPQPDTTLFENAINKMKGWLTDLWKTDTMQSFFNSFMRIGATAFNSIKQLASTMWDNVVLSWSEASPFIFEGLGNLVEYWRQMFEDVANTVETWLPSITDKLSTFIDNVFATFRPLTTFIAQLWRDFTQIMLDLWNEYGAPILNEIGKFMDGMIDTWNKIWTHIINPIITPAIQFLKKMWDEHIKDILYAIGDLIGTMILEALKFYNQFIKPIVDWLVVTLEPIFRKTFNTIFNVVSSIFGNVFNSIKRIIGNIKGVFQGLMTFLEGVFTGNWRKVWQGLVTIMRNIVGGIANIFKAPINIMIDGLNRFIRGLNKIKIPNWVPGVGGKGISIGTIPRLQRGGIVNRPMPAMLGDGGREAVIPLENDTRALEEIATMIGSMIGGGQGGDIVVQIGNETIFKAVIKEMQKKQMQMNGGAFVVI